MSPAGALDQPGYFDAHQIATPSRHTITISDARLVDGYLVINYEVWPLPAALSGQKSLLEHDNAGIAIDRNRRTYRDVRSGYRASHSGARLIGALRIGGGDWHHLGELTILFAPFAHTPGLRLTLCEVKIRITGDRVRVVSIRDG